VSWLAFISSLVHSLAWPTSAAVIAGVLRRPIAAMLGRGNIRRIRAGMFEVEFDQKLAEVREELSLSPELSASSEPALTLREDDLHRLADLSPSAAVLEAFKRVEHRLSQLLDRAEVPRDKMGVSRMTRLARERGLISGETQSAILDLAVLRNFTAHSPGDQLTAAQAHDYVTLARTILSALGEDGGAQPS
jgi:hypothetical protein